MIKDQRMKVLWSSGAFHLIPAPSQAWPDSLLRYHWTSHCQAFNLFSSCMNFWRTAFSVHDKHSAQFSFSVRFYSSFILQVPHRFLTFVKYFPHTSMWSKVCRSESKSDDEHTSVTHGESSSHSLLSPFTFYLRSSWNKCSFLIVSQ